MIFLYISFPYTILKEAAITQIAKQTGFDVRIHSLGPKLPLGFELEKVEVALPTGQKGIELESAVVRLSVLSLFVANATIDLELESKDGGTLESEVSISLIDALSGQVMPHYAYLSADGFALGHLIRFGIQKGKEALKGQALVADLLGNFGAKGALHGELELSLDTGKPTASSGSVDLSIKKGLLMIDPSLGMADQKFEKALVKAQLKGGKLKIDNRSGFHTQGLKIDVFGAVAMKNRIDKSSLNIDVKIELDKGLKEQFGFIIDTALGGSNGQLKCQIRGTMAHPNVITL